MTVGYEAKCRKCGETFNPHDFKPVNLIHVAKEDGTYCNGQGEPVGSWS